MSDLTLERAASAIDFERPDEIAALAKERFILPELLEALSVLPFPVPKSTLVNIVSRDRVSLVAEPPKPSTPRKFHLLDCYTVALFLSLDREISHRTDHLAESRRALRTALDHLLWGGDLLTPAEATTRRNEFASERNRARRGSGKAARANDEFIFGLHEQRRRELQRDIFAAPPFVWSRDLDRNWLLFLRLDVSLSVGLIDRNGPSGGLIDPDLFSRQGFTHVVNLTRALGGIDEKLGEIVKRRGGPELVEA